VDVTLPKGRIGTGEFTGRTASPLPVLADKTPVTEFVIFKPGVNESDYGPVTFDEIAAAFIMQNRAQKANPLKFDYNHGMALRYATAEQGKSAGDFDIEVRDGALLAVGCMWTQEAYGRIKGGEYSLFSPWFDYIDTEDGIRRPFALHNVAILNLAGLDGVQQIAAGAAATTTQETVMNEAEIKALQDRNRQLETEIATLRQAQHEVTVLTGTLQLGSSAGAAERAQAVHGMLLLRADLRKLTGQESDAGAIGVVETWKEKAGQADVLVAKQASIEAAALATELNTVLDDGIKAAKIAPGDREIFEAAALAKGAGKPSKEGISYLRGRIEARGKQVSTDEVGQKKPGSPEITDATRVVAVQMGIKVEDIELFRTDPVAWAEKMKNHGRPAAAR